MNRNRIIGYAEALSAAFIYGLLFVANRHGLLTYGSPFVAAVAGLLAGTIAIWLMTSFVDPAGLTKVTSMRPVYWMALTGIVSGVGNISNLLALQHAPAVVVVPVTSSYALVTVLMVRFFLRHDERLNLRIVAGTLLIVGGIMLVTLWK